MPTKPALELLAKRKGAVRRADVPPDVLDALNAGLIPTITMVEWLALDLALLLRAVLPGAGLRKEARALLTAYEPLKDLGITVRMKGIGRLLWQAIESRDDRDAVFAKLATHPADTVRAWAGYMLTADATLPLAERLEKAKPFAADIHMAVRECAWDSFRPYLARDLANGLRLLKPWVKDPDPNVRRCAIEATRPRGVWTEHIASLKEDPGRAIHLLEPVKSDPSRYVQNSVANWLNDASKTRPEWVLETCQRWETQSPNPQATYILNRALRTLRKK